MSERRDTERYLERAKKRIPNKLGKQRAMRGGENERASDASRRDTWSGQNNGFQISLANKERCAVERMSERATRHGEIPGAGKTPDSKIAGK